jgi:hypothetical protein
MLRSLALNSRFSISTLPSLGRIPFLPMQQIMQTRIPRVCSKQVSLYGHHVGTYQGPYTGSIVHGRLPQMLD